MIDYKNFREESGSKITTHIGLAILIAIGTLMFLWATSWGVYYAISDNNDLAIAYSQINGIDLVPFLDIVTSPRKLALIGLSGATSIFIGIAIARKELGPDK